MNAHDNPVIFFDGVCNICHGFVQFVLKYERTPLFYFASLQSEYSREILAKENRPFASQRIESVLLYKDGVLYQKSEAVIEILKSMHPIGRMAVVFKILPRVVRDFFYDFIAKYRYSIFGRNDQCMIPSGKWKDRFLG
jgi:predicted DCC family thiol-disulfide oxidoreductase YuxK